MLTYFRVGLPQDARFDREAEFLGSDVPGCLVGQLKRDRDVEAVAQEQGHVARHVAHGHGLEIGNPIVARF